MKNLMRVQEELNQLYHEKLSKNNINKLPELENLSAPLLIKVYENYLKSDLRIMYIGKETNDWLTSTKIPENKRGIKGVYSKNSLDINRLLNRYDKRMTQKNNWKKNAFFKQYKNIKDQLVDTVVGSGSIVWNNLFKMSYDRGKGYSKTSLGHSTILHEISKEIFLNELKILEPNILIFVTGSTYDKVIKDYLHDYKTEKVIIPKKLWKFKYQNILCYRTVHPDSIRFIKKSERKDYYQMIIDDIKLNTAI